MEKHNGCYYPNLKSFAFNYVYKARIYLYYYPRPTDLTQFGTTTAVVDRWRRFGQVVITQKEFSRH